MHSALAASPGCPRRPFALQRGGGSAPGLRRDCAGAVRVVPGGGHERRGRALQAAGGDAGPPRPHRGGGDVQERWGPSTAPPALAPVNELGELACSTSLAAGGRGLYQFAAVPGLQRGKRCTCPGAPQAAMPLPWRLPALFCSCAGSQGARELDPRINRHTAGQTRPPLPPLRSSPAAQASGRTTAQPAAPTP